MIQYILYNLIKFIGVTYGALILIAVLFTNPLMYPVRKASYQDSASIIKIKTTQQHLLSVLYLKAKSTTQKPPYVLLYSHGNAEDLGTASTYLHHFTQKGFSLISYDYSGYGTSTGQPSEINTYHDIEAVYQYLTQTLKIPSHRIIAYGRSLGAGPTLELAQHHTLAGVIIEGGFINAFRVITHFPMLPFSPYQNLDKIDTINCPLLIIHAVNDRVIPLWHGQTLYARARPPKFYFWAKDEGHNTLIEGQNQDYWKALIKFRHTLARQ